MVFEFQEALGNLNPTSNNGEKNPSASLRRSSEDKSKPTNSSAPMTSETNNDEQSAKKPDWLAELSRKQANRRSAVFPPASSSVVVEPSSDTSTSNVKSGSTSPPKIQNETKPAVAVDKPHIPLKPSQIREEGIEIQSKFFPPKKEFFVLFFREEKQTQSYCPIRFWQKFTFGAKIQSE